MINKNIIFDDFSSNAAMWCEDGIDSGELARVADVIIKRNVPIVSVAPNMVLTLWPWIEKTNAKILARFYLNDKKVSESQISDLTGAINNSFKGGASGAMVFLHRSALDGLVEQTHVIRDDLFFNKYLSLGLSLEDIDSGDWNELFLCMQKINASALTLVLTKDDGDKSDFVGRIYGMLDSWDSNNNFDLHFILGHDFCRIEQVLRLMKSVRPELVQITKFFINY